MGIYIGYKPLHAWKDVNIFEMSAHRIFCYRKAFTLYDYHIMWMGIVTQGLCVGRPLENDPDVKGKNE